MITIRGLAALAVGGALLWTAAEASTPKIEARKIASGLHDGSTYGPKLRVDGSWVAYGVREDRKGEVRSLYYARSLVEDSRFRTVWPNKHPSFKPKEGPNSFTDLVAFEWHPGSVHNAMIARHKREGNDILIEDMKLRFGGEGDDEQAFFTQDGSRVVATVRSPLGTDLWTSEVRPGARPEQLTWTRDFERWPDWHPTDLLILHEMYDRKQGDLFTFAIEGFEQKPLLQLPGSDEVRPSWASDGERFAYLSNRDQPGSSQYDLFVGRIGAPEDEPHKKVINNVRVSEDSRSYCWDPEGRYLLAIQKDEAAGFPFVVAPSDGSREPTKLPIDVVDNLDPSLARIVPPAPGAPAEVTEGEEAPAETPVVDAGPTMMRLSWVAPDADRKRGDASWRIVYAAEFPESTLLKLAGIK